VTATYRFTAKSQRAAASSQGDYRFTVAAAQYVADAAAVTAQRTKLLSTVTLLGVAGQLTLPSTADVRHGTQYGTYGELSTGTCYVPLASQVLSGVAIDASQGTFTYPGTGHVRYGTNYGVGGTSMQGICHVPTASQVLYGVSVDAVTGTVVLPAQGDVRHGTQYGAGQQSTGACHVPLQGEVLYGTSVDVSGTGTVVLPDEGDVRLDVTYGPGGSLEGTLDVAAGSVYPQPSYVLKAAGTYGPTGVEYVGLMNRPVLRSAFGGW
jgi:hypothetical protein